MTEETNVVDKTGPIVRIVLRYIAGGLVTMGLVSPETAEVPQQDPDLLWMLGAAVGVITEGFYSWAKKKGWAT